MIELMRRQFVILSLMFSMLHFSGSHCRTVIVTATYCTFKMKILNLLSYLILKDLRTYFWVFLHDCSTC